MQYMLIITKVLSLNDQNPSDGEVHVIPQYVIKLASDLQHVGSLGFFSSVLRFHPPIKLTTNI